MTKQIVKNIEKCFECPFIEWDYLPKGDLFQYCDNPILRYKTYDEKTVNINSIPDWCPLPDKI